jgi:hypothetical protein
MSFLFCFFETRGGEGKKKIEKEAQRKFKPHGAPNFRPEAALARGLRLRFGESNPPASMYQLAANKVQCSSWNALQQLINVTHRLFLMYQTSH